MEKLLSQLAAENEEKETEKTKLNEQINKEIEQQNELKQMIIERE